MYNKYTITGSIFILFLFLLMLVKAINLLFSRSENSGCFLLAGYAS